MLLTLLGFILSGLLGAVSYFLPAYADARQIFGQKGTPPPVAAGPGGTLVTPEPDSGPPPPGAPFTVLLLGSDDDSKFDGTFLTQSMILVRVDPNSNTVSMLSIPRDLYVPLSTGGTDKIDKAYLYGGPQAAVATVERDFQVHIDNYVWIGLEGLVKVIDTVGGVDVVTVHPVMDDFYPADLTSSNAYDYSRVAVMGGAQHLDGLHAMEYVRSRHDDLFSDLGRSQRQQQVLVALRTAANNRVALGDIPKLTAALKGEFTTDMDLSQLPSLLGLAKKISPEQTGHVFILPPLITDGKAPDGEDVLKPDWDSILPLVHQTFPQG
jgi:LCP family protein required for cell wall assembly